MTSQHYRLLSRKYNLSNKTLPFALHYLYRESNNIFLKVLIFSLWHNLGIIRFELSDKFVRVVRRIKFLHISFKQMHFALFYRIFSKCSVIKVTLGKSMCLILTTKAFLQPLLLGTNIYVKRCSV